MLSISLTLSLALPDPFVSTKHDFRIMGKALIFPEPLIINLDISTLTVANLYSFSIRSMLLDLGSRKL